MMRYFRLTLAALAMIAVALVSAGITMRIALHGGEVTVPNFSNMSISDASNAALHSGLDLSVENKFYSTVVPAGRILSQAPAAGSRVRKKWPVRVTVSLGPQQVEIPDVVGQPQREATMSIRRMSLDLGTVGHLSAPGDPDIVLSQTPPPNAGVDRPRVSILLSGSDDSTSGSFVMPSFVGMSWSAANHAAAALGLRTSWIGDSAAPTAPPTPPPGTIPGPNGTFLDASGNPVTVSAAPATPSGPVTAQKPEPGHRANKGDTVRLTFGHAPNASVPPLAAPPQTP